MACLHSDDDVVRRRVQDSLPAETISEEDGHFRDIPDTRAVQVMNRHHGWLEDERSGRIRLKGLRDVVQ